MCRFSENGHWPVRSLYHTAVILLNFIDFFSLKLAVKSKFYELRYPLGIFRFKFMCECVEVIKCVLHDSTHILKCIISTDAIQLTFNGEFLFYL